MGNELTASYRLVYFQPDPEDGERVCVALLFNTGRDVELLYDPDFPKLRCLAPKIRPGMVRVYLDAMAENIRHETLDADFLLRRHVPQLITSEKRQSVWPLSEKARQYLMKRFLSKERGDAPTHAAIKEDTVKAHLKGLIGNLISDHIADLREDADSQWVLGKKVPEIKPVALALRKPNETLLIDGIDLNVLKPIAALKRVNKVTHTFWQYGRIRQMGLSVSFVRRIAVVLNGKANADRAYKDAHDFALHQFGKDAEHTIDTASITDLRQLEMAIRSGYIF